MLSSLVLSVALAAQTPAPQEPYPRIRLADYIPSIQGAAPPSDDAWTFVRRGDEDALPVTPPQVVMSAHEDMLGTSLSVAFNWVWLSDDQGRRPVWFARLRASRGRGAIERFADSRQCPGVEASLRQLDDLALIEPRVPGLPNPSRSPDMTDFGIGWLHDNTYRIRLRGLFAGAQYSDRLEMTGGSLSPFAPVIADTLTRLKPCWTETPPPRA